MVAIPITAIGAITTAVIRVLAAYLLCYVLALLSQRARVRHAIWMIFVAAVSLYWIVTLGNVLLARSGANPAPTVTPETAPVSVSTTIRVTVPLALKSGFTPRALATASLLYFIGAAVMVGRLLSRRRRLRIALSQSYAVDSGLQSTFEDECARLDIRRCEILELPGIRSPGTAYVWHRVVIIPEGMESFLDDEQFVDVLYHELMHIRRNDFLWNTLAELANCLLFFHPAMWLAMRNLARERELACDMAVMELRQGRQSDYALCLTQFERRRAPDFRLDLPNHLALLSSFLSLRVKSLLADKHRRGPFLSVAAATAGTAILLTFAVGWPSLSLGVQLESGPMAAAVAARSTIPADLPKLSSVRRILPSRPSAGPSFAPTNSAQLVEVAATQPVVRYRSPVDPALDTVDEEVAASSLQKKSRARNGNEEGSPTASNLPDWPKTAVTAAVGAISRIGSGRHDHDEDADDRSTKPF